VRAAELVRRRFPTDPPHGPLHTTEGPFPAPPWCHAFFFDGRMAYFVSVTDTGRASDPAGSTVFNAWIVLSPLGSTRRMPHSPASI